MSRFGDTSRILDMIARQYRNRISNDTIGIKVNLYKGYEVEAVSRAIHNLEQEGLPCQIDCVMVADSFLMTHLGYPSTKLPTAAEQLLLFRVLCSLVYEVRVALSACFEAGSQPYLIADMPDGSTINIECALQYADRFIECGADVVKVEVSSEESLAVVEALSQNDVLVMAHIGYTPQSSENRRYGTSVKEIYELFRLARQVRDAGACALVVERVSEFVNRKLSQPSQNALPIYSIFSGQAKYGGQSLNVWDSVYKPSFKASLFPPTAEYEMSTYPQYYNVNMIEQHFQRLLKMTLLGAYPPPLRTQLKEEIIELASINPWTA